MPNKAPSVTWKRIAAKRANTTVGAIKARREIGEPKRVERASIRIGSVNTDILTGDDDLSTWSDEELAAGRRRNRNGQWTGREPRIIPKVVHDELVRRTLSKANKMFNENLLKAVEILVDICQDPSVDAKDRLKAVQMITDRAMGKAPDTVKIEGAAPWVGAINAGIVSLGDEIKTSSIKANSWDEEDEEEYAADD